jgi:glycosyltransferase involved in cell wall biosynthesis
MTGKLPVSVCILVLNEEDRLERCLSSLDPFSEIAVLDSGSSDGSLAICRARGAKIYEKDWQGFGKMRRELFALASQPWVLWLDADEVVSRDLADELQRLFTSPVAFDAFAVNRMVFFEGKWIRHGDWFPDWNIRLFRQGSWTMEEREVHECVRIRGKVGRLGGLIEHYTYRDWADRERRSERYAELWAREKAAKRVRTFPGAPALRGAIRFLKGYILKGGFLDGALGARIALSNAREAALKYKLLRKFSNEP